MSSYNKKVYYLKIKIYWWEASDRCGGKKEKNKMPPHNLKNIIWNKAETKQMPFEE